MTSYPTVDRRTVLYIILFSRKEVEVIRPRVQSLKGAYEADFGSPATLYQTELDSVQTKTRTLNAKLVLINDILRKLAEGEGKCFKIVLFIIYLQKCIPLEHNRHTVIG